MDRFSPKLKHFILTQYEPQNRRCSFQALAIKYGVAGGKSTIKKWHKRWDGTPQSLERKIGSGHTRLLTHTQVYKYIAQPIIRKNRQHRPIHYVRFKEQIKNKQYSLMKLV
jgi:transposase